MAELERNDWTGLWHEVCLMAARPIPPDVSNRCQAELMDAKWDTAKDVLEKLREESRVPGNIFGWITSQIKYARRARYARGNLSDATPEDDSPYDTRPIAVLMGDVLQELDACRRAGVMVMQISAVGKPFPNIVEWYNQGCPPTWSDLHDRFLSGYYRAWLREQSGDIEAVISYMRACVVKLKAIRLKRDGLPNTDADHVPQAMEVE